MKRVSDQAGLDSLLREHPRAAVLFHATWCPFCRAFYPEHEPAVRRHGRFEPLEVLLDDEANPLWDRYQIEVVPTVLFFEHGQLVHRLDGMAGAGLRVEQLESALAQAGGGDPAPARG